MSRGHFITHKVDLLRNVFDALHHAVQLQCDTNGFRHITRVLDAHAQQLTDLVKVFLVGLSDLLVVTLVDKLDDSIWFALLR